MTVRCFRDQGLPLIDPIWVLGYLRSLGVSKKLVAVDLHVVGEGDGLVTPEVGLEAKWDATGDPLVERWLGLRPDLAQDRNRNVGPDKDVELVQRPGHGRACDPTTDRHDLA